MEQITSFKTFVDLCTQSELVPISGKTLGDLDTPVSAFLKLTSGRFRFLLESVEAGRYRGRYSIIGDHPLFRFTAKGKQTLLQDLRTDKRFERSGDPFEHLRQVVNRFQAPIRESAPLQSGGLFGYLGYDAVRYIERLPGQPSSDPELPEIDMFIPSRIVRFDNLLNTLCFIVFVTPSGHPKHDYQHGLEELYRMEEALHSQMPADTDTLNRTTEAPRHSISKSQFEDAVRQAKKSIERGDIFQVVLSQRLSVQSTVPPLDIYRALRMINPSPYMFYMDIDSVSLLGSSPETLVKLAGNRVHVKPIAGTRRRGKTEQEDQELVANLLQDPKERAEHTMLVDLGRNDVGRIARYGTVKIDELMSIEKYSHVIHIVSSVSGELSKECDAIDTFKACFPAGTVSGAPKVRAMEIIDSLEPFRRNIYAGAVGYFAFDGDMDVCIAIRTLYKIKDTLYIQAGAGIVADSQPEREYEETLNKARGLLKAIERAGHVGAGARLSRTRTAQSNPQSHHRTVMD